MKKALTIAGSDSSGGAGIQADLKTFAAHGVFGMSAITAITAQNTQAVLAVAEIPVEIVGRQIDAIFEDIEVDAVKIGMVSRQTTIIRICDRLRHHAARNIVVDPVMVSKSGWNLLQPDALAALRSELLPLATVLTPNIPEAEILAGMPIHDLDGMAEAAARIQGLGPAYVLLKGGHLPDNATDILYDGKEIHALRAARIDTKNTHGTGCTLSAAIAANLAKGMEVKTAVAEAKEYLTGAIAHALAIGKGVGPTHHFYDLYRKAGWLDQF
ncbi:hydroxymethylpyrimidine/phosphomethylpyrimidine kinase [Hydrogenispora ethanolica]|uniref:Hydroxymethylpyrimidine/phosphomethylpyrimidine kinase n=1 Tax=Hydrogenispora ethanolica TaxID=1082276 RepID=A0A4R1R1N7_HYDET|nr:bifunctional hydroxymethylpyrimidine kinase/phosphomethylpyrimidine kinase [Hydrogenispora ethanolica]TCL59260.1 hydroxymethylpyrimidine/phosphomethylpyrimidine kinase [Hydrogenispora ethanolica]